MYLLHEIQGTGLPKKSLDEEQFLDLLDRKSEYPNKKVKRVAESDQHLFACSLSTSKGII